MGESQINGLLSPAVFQAHVSPVLLKLFEVHEEHVRMVLLSHLDAYAELFTQKELKNVILPQVNMTRREPGTNVSRKHLFLRWGSRQNKACPALEQVKLLPISINYIHMSHLPPSSALLLCPCVCNRRNKCALLLKQGQETGASIPGNWIRITDFPSLSYSLCCAIIALCPV